MIGNPDKTNIYWTPSFRENNHPNTLAQRRMKMTQTPPLCPPWKQAMREWENMARLCERSEAISGINNILEIASSLRSSQ